MRFTRPGQYGAMRFHGGKIYSLPQPSLQPGTWRGGRGRHLQQTHPRYTTDGGKADDLVRLPANPWPVSEDALSCFVLFCFVLFCFGSLGPFFVWFANSVDGYRRKSRTPKIIPKKSPIETLSEGWRGEGGNV